MGKGYMFECKKCKHQYGICPGIGFSYMSLCKKTLDKIAKGKYGKEFKAAYDNGGRYLSVNAQRILYMCDACKTWDSAIDATLYAPNNADAFGKMQYGIKTVEEWGEVPYFIEGGHFHVIKEYKHKCPKCKGIMRKANEEEYKRLACPKCGEINDMIDEIRWD